MRALALAFALCMLLCGCAAPKIEATQRNAAVRGMWVSYYELDFEDKSEQGFRSSVAQMFSQISELGFNTVFVHVRAYADACYPSKLFPFSKQLAGRRGGSLSYDPLKIMINAAHGQGLAFHAWVNPFRISNDKSDDITQQPTEAVLLQDKNGVKSIPEGLWLNPASVAARRLVLDGIRELLQYDIDGVHFDDYFYPTTDSAFDSAEYALYCKDNPAPMSQADFRRSCISSLVSAVYGLVKTQDSRLLFGISPQANMTNNYSSQYADIRYWCSVQGFIDYIAPQIYFGFEYNYTTPDGQPMDFVGCFDYWRDIAAERVALYIGLGLYRSGEVVVLHGEDNDEWVRRSDIIARQLKHIQDGGDGFIVFTYSSLYRNKNARAETENIKRYLAALPSATAT